MIVPVYMRCYLCAARCFKEIYVPARRSVIYTVHQDNVEGSRCRACDTKFPTTRCAKSCSCPPITPMQVYLYNIVHICDVRYTCYLQDDTVTAHYMRIREGLSHVFFFFFHRTFVYLHIIHIIIVTQTAPQFSIRAL